MLAFVLRRLWQAMLVMATVALVSFVLFQYVGDPVVFLLGQDATPEQVQQMRADLGLDQPFFVQFGHFLFNAAQGEFGISLRQATPVSQLIAERFPATLELALVAAIIGAISLRTRGVYFIMITLAFAQMIYYLVNSIKAYGGDEGLNIKQRSDFGLGLDLKNDVTFYFVVLFVLVLSLVLISRIMASRFGRVILAVRDDDVRVDAIGFASYRYKWVLFVIAGTLGGLAGALMVNHQNYVSPNLMHWTQSGILMVMVILGGVGTLTGGLWGALVLLIVEDVLAEYTVHWQFYVGWFLLAVVLLAPKGLAGLLSRKAVSKGGHT